MFSKQCKLVIKCLTKDSSSSWESHGINNESVYTVQRARNTLCLVSSIKTTFIKSLSKNIDMYAS